jgi:death-on-curing protein
VIYLEFTDLLYLTERVTGATPLVRDAGLLESAAARCRMTVFGADAYPEVEDKAAALLQSIVRNHPLVDGNKRLGFIAMVTFLGINGRRLTMSNDEAHDFVIEVATSRLTEIADIAARVRDASEPFTDAR